MAKHTEKFDPKEVPGLLEKACPSLEFVATVSPSAVIQIVQSLIDLNCYKDSLQAINEDPHVTKIVARFKDTEDNRTLVEGLTQDPTYNNCEVFHIEGNIEARDELLYRFQRLVATLVNVCITGRPNYWSSYQKTFLRMFAGEDTPIQNVASMLKRELASYEKEELFSTGQLAVLVAIEECKKNLATTIVYCFKDLIQSMIKDPSRKLNVELSECSLHTYEITNIETELALEIFLESLNPADQEVVVNIIEGKKTDIPDALKAKLKTYLQQ